MASTLMAWIKTTSRIAALFLGLILFAHLSEVGRADEVIIDDQTNTPFEVGDFKCSGCPEQVTRSMGLSDKNNSGQVSAGQLWQFFHDQGVRSTDRLTLCIDVDQIDSAAVFDLQSMQLQIEDPAARGSFLTSVSLGNNSLVVPGAKTSSFKPEAKLEILLDYDFMQRFSASSTEMIKLDFSSSGNLGSNPIISIEGNENVFNGFNFLMLFLFAGFWVVVFFVLNKVTKPLDPNHVIPKSSLTIAGATKANGGYSS